MKWFRTFFRNSRNEGDGALNSLRDKFTRFLTLLDNNNKVLKVIGDMEEKSQGDYLFDINYIRTALADVRSGVSEIIDNMIALGGERYAALKDRYAAMDAEIDTLLPGGRPIRKDDYTIPFEKLGRERAWSVGSKNAQLGEMKSRLGLPVPEGFAISAWAYKHFIDANDLQARISERIACLNLTRYDDLVRVSEEIQAMVTSSPVPEDLAEAIRTSYIEFRTHCSTEGCSLRSSAIGEDTVFSFAGQYATLLNIRSDEIVDRYREVLASKFTPKAIYYFLSHTISESELAMAVGCVAMVDAAASGVVYTRDPVRPVDGCMIVNSIYGLGKYLVDGTLTPDIFRVSRKDGSVKESHVATKRVRLVLGSEGGTLQEPVPAEYQDVPSISHEQIQILIDFALKIEAHYGTPQDIEWAMDREGRIFLLQTRPLRVMEGRHTEILPEISRLEVILSGGTTVCPGAGAGSVYHAASARDLAGTPDGAVLVAQNPFPGLITVMGKVSALVTEVGGVASHMATLAREYRVPTLAGIDGTDSLSAGLLVTVDATGLAIYEGIHRDLVAARRQEYDLFSDTAIFSLLRQVLTKISPLNLLQPGDPHFMPEYCRTFHDITRFAHQKAMEEMFSTGKELRHKERISARLKSDIPLQVLIIYLDEKLPTAKGKRVINDEEIASLPMQAFWNGIKEEGWPSRPPPADLKGFMSVMATDMSTGSRGEFSENSFAILSKEYMILSLRMGYHFTTIEAMCTDEVSKNYIRMQFKGGGASLDRRILRVKLLTDILSRAGFEHSSRGDFIDTMISYQESRAILDKLRLLGRITMMTKQLDMALSNESITQWYTEDFLKKLGLMKIGGR